MVQLLLPERVAIASTKPDQHLEEGIEALALDQHTSAHAPLQNIRVGLRDVASATALSIQHLSQATVEQALEIGQQLWRMQRELKKKEYSTFLSILGWASAKARKFINLAKVFHGFEPSQLETVYKENIKKRFINKSLSYLVSSSTTIVAKATQH